MNLMHGGVSGGVAASSQARYQSQMLTQQQQQQQQYQRLKVEDALSYLDKVKFQFQSQPNIYNMFLDIMKEFKSQTIDTMGVISRVSELFDGHSELIVGFNTFLPPGYKIEMNSTRDSINVYHDGQRVPSLGTSLSLRSGTTAAQTPGSASHLSSGISVYDTAPHLASRQPPTQRHAGASGSSSADASATNQPVEFDHAIIYVNKIKSRYQNRPDIYKQFLDILHYYQKVQRDLKDGNPPQIPPMTENEVYDKVAKLFQDQPDLLQEFGQFLPDAGGGTSSSKTGSNGDIGKSVANLSATVISTAASTPSSAMKKLSCFGSKSSVGTMNVGRTTAGHRRRLSASVSSVTVPLQVKKIKTELVKDVSLAEAGKYGSLTDFAFFDKIRKTLNSDRAYTDFLRCVKLYTMGVISSSDFLIMIQPFFVKAPELKKRLKELLRHRDDALEPTVPTTHGTGTSKDRMTGEFAMDIDFASCKKYTESYRGLPSSYVAPRCGGRSELCNEVLNDTLVSFPSWSEDSSSVIKKTMAEEQIFRCEEDRYQLDIVLENVNSTILALEGIADKLSRMSTDDQAKFRLDNCLGGRSEFLHRKTIHRLYKEHGAPTIDALKRNPAVAVPLVLHRLKAKASQLRDAKRSQQKIWNDQNQKYYMKSLDHQGLNFKQSDMKQLRSKALLAEIDAAFDERQEQLHADSTSPCGPLMTLVYRRPAAINDATALVIHHVKRQSSIHCDEKRKIKRLMRHFLPSLFFMPCANLSDDEEDDIETIDRETVVQQHQRPDGTALSGNGKQLQQETTSSTTLSVPATKSNGNGDDSYSLLFGNNNWYLLMRLHYILCDRLAYFYNHAQTAIEAEREKPKTDSVETAYALCLKPSRIVEPDRYYETFLDMVRNYLDGHIETATYEEQLRDMFGIHAYIGFTMDKLIQNIVRQLQHIVTDATCVQLMELYNAEQRTANSHQHRVVLEQSYQRKVELLLTEDSCFKIAVLKKDCRLMIDQIDQIDQLDNIEEATDAWREYISQFVSGTEATRQDSIIDKQQQVTDLTSASSTNVHPVLLHRNVRRFMDRNKLNVAASGRRLVIGSGSETTLATSSDSGLSLMDDIECRFSVNSFRMLYVANSESLLYREHSLSVARKTLKSVSTMRHERFASWVESWVEEFTTSADLEACEDFLMGRPAEGRVPCVTVKQTIADETTAPYYAYNRYCVNYTAVDKN